MPVMKDRDMFIPQYRTTKRHNETEPAASGFGAFEAYECYELLDAVISRGRDAVVVIESESGDLRDYTFVYTNSAFSLLTAPSIDGGTAVRSTVLTEVFGDPSTLTRIYTSLDDKGSISLDHLTRSLDGSLRLLGIEITSLSLNAVGVPRWVVVIKNDTDNYNNGAKLHEMLAGARCMVWHALVEALDGDLIWTMRVLNEESAQRWLPIDMPEGASYAAYWPTSWLPGEAERMHTVSQSSIWSGASHYQQEFRCRTADGKIHWISEDVRIDSRGPGRWRLVAVCTDITDHKLVEEALRNSEQRLSSHVQRTPLAVIEWNLDGDIVDWNPSAERIFGYNRNEALGQNMGLIISVDNKNEIQKIWSDIMMRRGGEHITKVNTTKDGRAITCEWYHTPLVDENGETIGVASMALDITDRKRTEQLLVQESNFLRILMDNIPDSVFIKDNECRYQRLSRHLAKQYLGVNDPNEAIGKTDFDFCDQELARSNFDEEQNIMRTCEPILNKVQIENIGSLGNRWVSTTKAPILDEAGNVTGTVGITRDITERVLAEEEARSAEQEMHHMITSARCLVWHASVREDADTYRWNIHITDEESAKRWLPIDIPEDMNFADAWLNISRLPEDAEIANLKIQEALHNNLPGYSHEFRCRMQDGEIRWLSEDVRIDKMDNVFRLVGVCVDITERKLAEDQLNSERVLLRTIIDNLPESIYVTDRECRYIINNPAHNAQLGVGSSSDVVTKSPFDFYNAAQAVMYDAETRTVLETGEPLIDREDKIILADGNKRYISTTKVPLRDDFGHILGVVGIDRDITQYKNAQEILAKERNQLRTLIDNIPLAIYFKDQQCRFLINNTAHAQILGVIDTGELAGKTDSQFTNPILARHYYDDDMQVLNSGMPLINRVEPVIYADGIERWHSTTKVPLRDRSGSIIGLIGISQDITQQKAMEAERERMLTEAIERADRDPLTGLLNHRAFHKLVTDEITRTTNINGSMALAVMDLDNFKFFNDAYGHTVGDSVLCQVASALHGCCKSFDVLARFGGDEFALLMPDTSAMEAYQRAEELMRCLDGVGYTPPGYDVAIPLSISIGVSVYPDDGTTKLELVNVADDRLMRAKTGEGSSELFTDELKERLAGGFNHFTMLNALVSAVDNKDRYTRRHSVDVVTYTLEIAREMNLNETELFYIQLAALLHDVGKIGVPDAVLRKPGRLNDAEFDAIKQHPTMGAIMVGAVEGFGPTLDAVRHHHERWDGQGYPSGLKGTDIPFTARIMAVADSYSAMTTDRPYRKGMDPEVAFSILEKGKGTQWDPDCVEVFLKVRRMALGH